MSTRVSSRPLSPQPTHPGGGAESEHPCLGRSPLTGGRTEPPTPSLHGAHSPPRCLYIGVDGCPPTFMSTRNLTWREGLCPREQLRGGRPEGPGRCGGWCPCEKTRGVGGPEAQGWPLKTGAETGGVRRSRRSPRSWRGRKEPPEASGGCGPGQRGAEWGPCHGCPGSPHKASSPGASQGVRTPRSSAT